MSEDKVSRWVLARVGHEETIRLPEGHSEVGRLSQCDIRICSRFCSRRHCKFSVCCERIAVSDFSSNGVYVNGRQFVGKEVELYNNDRVGIGVDATDDECASDMNYFIFILRKTPLTSEVTNSPRSRGKNRDQDVSKADINDCSKVESEGITDEIRKENKVAAATDSKYEDEVGSNKMTLLGKKCAKGRESVDKENMDLIEIREGGLPLKTGPFIVSTENTRQPDEVVLSNHIFVISDEEEEADNEILHHNKCKTSNSLQKVSTNLTKSDADKTELDKTNSSNSTASRKNSKHILRTESVRKNGSEDADSKQASLLITTKLDSTKRKCSPKSTDKMDISCNDTILASEKHVNIEDLKNNERNIQSISEAGNASHLDLDADEESEMLMSQSLIKDIKQEIVDLEMSFISEGQHITESNVDSTFIEQGKEGMSPLIDLDDDEENILQNNNNPETDWDNMYQDKSKEEEQRKPKLAEKRKMPEIIDPPSLPEKRGKLRGVSAEIITPKSNVEIIHKKNITSKNKDKAVSRDQWRQKPTLQKRAQNKQVKILQEERKQKLRELAKEQACKRKSNDDEGVKIVNKPKVKVTRKNRGAFLTGEGQEKCNAMSSDSCKKSAPKQNFKRFPIDNILVKQDKTEECSETLEKFNAHDYSKVNKIFYSEPKKHDAQSLVTVGEVVINDIQQQSKNCSRHRKDSRIKIISEQVASIKSIVKKSDSSTPRKNVTFCNKPKIIYIPSEKCSEHKIRKEDVPVHLLTRANTENILSAILTWNPAWLATRKEEVNGRHHVLLPMLHKFPTFDDFIRIILPLMKLELWAQIEQMTKTQKGSSISLRVQNYRIEKRGDFNRSVFYCDYVPFNFKNGFPFNISDLCIITAESSRKSLNIFGYIDNFKKIGFTQNPHYEVIVQSIVSTELNELIDVTKRITVKPITQLRVDLGAFTAVHHLKYSSLLESILDPTNLLNSKVPSTENIRYKGYDEMNENQRDVLLKTYLKSANLDESNICLIEGPPGTGKSRLISNLVLQLLYGDESRSFEKKILICSQSNAAIDVITSKLLKIRNKMVHSKFRLVRFGILERMSPAVRGVSVQSLIERQLIATENLDTLKKERELLESKIRQLSKKIESGTNSVQYDELQKLKQRLDIVNRLPYQQNLMQKRKTMYQRQIQGAHIVCTTLSSCIHMLQYTSNFDICIVDEATLCLEPWTLIPLQFDISSLVLVGDTQQLPATVLSKISAAYGLGQSLFTRIQKCLGSGDPILHLRTQYRMHPEICKWPNSYFYNNMLMSDKSTEVKLPIKPYSILNLDFSTNEDFTNGNIINKCESDFVTELLIRITKLLPTTKFTYGVITPYAQQRDIISQKLRMVGINDIPVNTIDSCQGKEKDVIIISNARTKGVGFLGNSQRLNVALTRAKRCLILCGRFSCVEDTHVWKSLLDDAKNRQLFHNISKHHLQDFEKYVMAKLLC